MKRVIVDHRRHWGPYLSRPLPLPKRFKARHPEATGSFRGRCYAVPRPGLLRKAGLEFEALPVQARSSGAALAGSGRVLAAGTSHWEWAKPCRLHGRFKPQVVLGFRRLCGFRVRCLPRPCVERPRPVHEQNSVPGVTNRMLGKVVRKILVSFPDSSGRFLRQKGPGADRKSGSQEHPLALADPKGSGGGAFEQNFGETASRAWAEARARWL